NCRRCQQPLYRRQGKEWVTDRGYHCINPACGSTNGKGPQTLDLELARHARCSTPWEPTGRTCPECGLARETYVPAVYRRVKDQYDLTIVDEAHNYKEEPSLCGRAVRSFRSPLRILMTGTPTPNFPDDAYYPLTWMGRGGSELFPYAWRAGYLRFLHDY